MKNFFTFTFLIIFQSYSYSQNSFWTQTNGPYGGTVSDYSFGTQNIVYAAAGDSGAFKSTDNGVTWSSIGSAGQNAGCICKLSSGAILAGIFRTTNEGANWITTNLPATVSFIKQINQNLIIAASSNGIYKSTNDGINWTQTMSLSFNYIDASANNEIYVSGYNSGLYKSINGGDNWERINGYNQPYTLSVNVAINGYIFATTWNGSIFRSRDNGASFSDVGYSSHIYKTTKAVATNDGYLYCGTFYQGIWSSSDYGESWEKQYPGERINFYVTHLCEGFNGNIFACVINMGVVRTTNKGADWNAFGLINKFQSITNLFQADDGKIFSNTGHISTDNGVNWIYPDFDFEPVSFAKNSSKGFLFAADGSSNGWKVGGIYKSTDNGDNWEFLNLTNLGNNLHYLFFSQNNNLYTLNLHGDLFKSTDNGVNWSAIPNLQMFTVTENISGVIFGKKLYGGGVYRTTNLGQRWNLVLPLGNDDSPVYLTASGDLYAGGNNTLFKSTNNGDNWTQLNITGKVTSISENQSGRIFVSVYSGGVYYVDHDTVTDISFDIGNRKINSLCFNSSGQLLAGTTTGIYKTNASVISVNNLNQNIPDDCVLYQNYPNPFNPVTVIRYSLPAARFISIKVYDVLGNEVAILVNERQNTGSYEVEFDGANYPSGVYFYRLQTESFSETKMMTLLK